MSTERAECRQIVSVTEVVRKGDHLAISLAVRSETDWIHCPVFAQIQGDRLVEWTTTPPECFFHAPEQPAAIPGIRLQ